MDIKRASHLEIFTPDIEEEQPIPFSENGVAAGFPSPAEDFMDMALDLNKELVRNPASTFYARVRGTSMIDEGINNGDLLIIDKSVEPHDGALAVCFIDGEFTLKRFRDMGDHALLMPANKEFKPIVVNRENDFQIWGIVRYLIKKV
ncbi:MAG: translesion error-prone DNA polymerase V autoproteolytic subunit [Marinifilaceae bacterium]|nr:translesion error-prone DNA polymerase V autoproteolytic subunit [Marinifilaceae bacterium]